MVSGYSCYLCLCMILMFDDSRLQTLGSKRSEMRSCLAILLLGLGSSISLLDVN
jgi:hypothetical protein